MDFDKMLLDVDQVVEIKAPAAKVFEALLHKLTDENTRPDGVPMPMKMELRPGGRWYRDLGNDTGHCWATVQSIKPPALLEFQGPMFMSYPVSGHLIIRLQEEGGVTRLSLRHRALGLIDENHRAGATMGWNHYLTMVKKDCE